MTNKTLQQRPQQLRSLSLFSIFMFIGARLPLISGSPTQKSALIT